MDNIVLYGTLVFWDSVSSVLIWGRVTCFRIKYKLKYNLNHFKVRQQNRRLSNPPEM